MRTAEESRCCCRGGWCVAESFPAQGVRKSSRCRRSKSQMPLSLLSRRAAVVGRRARGFVVVCWVYFPRYLSKMPQYRRLQVPLPSAGRPRPGDARKRRRRRTRAGLSWGFPKRGRTPAACRGGKKLRPFPLQRAATRPCPCCRWPLSPLVRRRCGRGNARQTAGLTPILCPTAV